MTNISLCHKPNNGRTVTSTAVSHPSQKRRVSKRAILEILHTVKDPGVPMPLEEMGIVSREWIHIEGEDVQVEFRPTSPFCPVGLALGVVIKNILEESFDRDVKVRIVRGSHLQEKLVNDLLGNRERYLKTLERLRSSGFVGRCCY
jgi:metal-sulfur cluster biosynthetic enzyme